MCKYNNPTPKNISLNIDIYQCPEEKLTFLGQFQELLRYPESRWGEPASDRWISLCTALCDYVPPPRRLSIDKERKWELVSAFQKSIRRGDKPMALHLISAMDSMPGEWAYLWRRLCVIACEDVGLADDILVSFVVACATVFPPKRTGKENYLLFCFLAEQMCGLSTRSRIYCSYGVVEAAANKSELPELFPAEKPIVSTIMQQRAAIRSATNLWQQWQKKNDWRAAGLLKFVGLRLPLKMTTVEAPVPPYKMLFDLPSCCYDMYTRVGLTMLRRLVQGVKGAEGIKEVFQQNEVKSAHRAVGEALFFAEGGRIKGELVYAPLCSLEQRLSPHQFGLPMDAWLNLRVLVEKALEEGIVDRVREEVLRQTYGQGKLQLIAQGERDAGNTSN